MAPMPSAIKNQPPEVRAALKKACGGDWSRVEVTGSGIVVHNQGKAVRSKAKERPSTAPVVPVEPVKEFRRIELPPARPKAVRARAKAPNGSGCDKPSVLDGCNVVEIEEEPKAPTTPEIVPVEKEPEGWRPSQNEPVIFPGDEEGEGFHPRNVKADVDVHTLVSHVSKGVGDKLTITIQRSVTDCTGLDMVEAVRIVRRAQWVEARPESVEKGYPIIRFVGGDVSVIVGFRYIHRPSILRIDQNFGLLTHDTHRVEHHGGGGGARKAKGLPARPETIATALRAFGCDIPEFDYRSETPVPVKYKGKEIGLLSPKRCTKDEGERTYQRLVRIVDTLSRKT